VEVKVQLSGSADARALIRSRLRDQAPELIEVAQLLTTELVNNAITHGAGEPILMIDVHEDRIHVEVYDANLTLELNSQSGDPLRASGRGLAFVEELASSWGVARRLAGKVVWFDLASK
jgi:anti-sigma regulatory factor (Ser/Thr protein kinase)